MTMHFMNDIINDIESRPPDKSVYWKIIFFISHPKHMWWVLNSLNETVLLSTQNTFKLMGKTNRIPGSHLLISSLPGSAMRKHDESLGKPCDVNKRSR